MLCEIFQNFPPHLSSSPSFYTKCLKVGTRRGVIYEILISNCNIKWMERYYLSTAVTRSLRPDMTQLGWLCKSLYCVFCAYWWNLALNQKRKRLDEIVCGSSTSTHFRRGIENYFHPRIREKFVRCIGQFVSASSTSLARSWGELNTAPKYKRIIFVLG
jgi:hypothetical protein